MFIAEESQKYNVKGKNSGKKTTYSITQFLLYSRIGKTIRTEN